MEGLPAPPLRPVHHCGRLNVRAALVERSKPLYDLRPKSPFHRRGKLGPPPLRHVMDDDAGQDPLFARHVIEVERGRQ